jgi:hypothetical protein
VRSPVRCRLSAGVVLAFLLCLFCGPVACKRTDVRPPPPPIPPPPAEAAAPPAPPEPPVPPVASPAQAPEGPKVESRYTGEQQPPVGLPDDVPLYAQATPISSMASPDRGTIVNLRSTDSAEQVFAWYRDELAKRGWTIATQSGAGAQHLLTATKDTRKASVLITTGAATQILLTVLAAK